MVSMLCVLDAGTAWYSVARGDPFYANFMRDRTTQLTLQIDDGEPQNVFYRHHVLRKGHLTRLDAYRWRIAAGYAIRIGL